MSKKFTIPFLNFNPTSFLYASSFESDDIISNIKHIDSFFISNFSGQESATLDFGGDCRFYVFSLKNKKWTIVDFPFKVLHGYVSSVENKKKAKNLVKIVNFLKSLPLKEKKRTGLYIHSLSSVICDFLNEKQLIFWEDKEASFVEWKIFVFYCPTSDRKFPYYYYTKGIIPTKVYVPPENVDLLRHIYNYHRQYFDFYGVKPTTYRWRSQFTTLNNVLWTDLLRSSVWAPEYRRAWWSLNLIWNGWYFVPGPTIDVFEAPSHQGDHEPGFTEFSPFEGDVPILRVEKQDVDMILDGNRKGMFSEYLMFTLPCLYYCEVVSGGKRYGVGGWFPLHKFERDCLVYLGHPIFCRDLSEKE